VHREADFPVEQIMGRWDQSEQLARFGITFLLYGLLDVLVDGYLAVIDVFDQYMDRVADRIFSEQPIDRAEQQQWFRARRELVRFHRLVGPTRETISALMRREQDLVPEKLYPYYQDIYDHVLRVSEASDALRDLVSTVVETNLSLRDYRQNLVMKKVTSWAAVVAVPTLITGFYGMNVPYPGFGTHGGVWASVGLIVVCSTLLWALFKKRDWL
jgi:magnesium transporter